MADDGNNNTYEEARKRRLLDNKKRFEDLGILKISKSLSDLKGTEKKSQQRSIKPKSRSLNVLEPRRSSRARNPVPSYRDDVEIDLAPFSLRKKYKFDSSWARLSSLSFCVNVTPINGLPTAFCEEHLPKSTENMVLEDENGTEYDAVFISKRTGLSGGWRAFALDHKLDDGDALVFELTEPTRFKARIDRFLLQVYTVRASHCSSTEDDTSNADEDENEDEKVPAKVLKLNKKGDTKLKHSTELKKILKSSQVTTRKSSRLMKAD
ncbi:hypothetical protein RJ639_011599 [Escallonia herrerae]|uniref:TF-B3 domain-containing protein n=1 Tax=Escallonia herrerae TaxID=1293975 RepID=A0AA88VRF3_9ASTE|nr:hypothetical protein RJ639_011599 [Escallonia herrerae]